MDTIEIDLSIDGCKGRQPYKIGGFKDVYWCDSVDEVLVVIQQELENAKRNLRT